jgi:hypothetical protein
MEFNIIDEEELKYIVNVDDDGDVSMRYSKSSIWSTGTRGNHKKDLKLSDRTYNCDKCNNSIDRDLNAAYNIKNFGVRDNPLYANVSH